MIQHLLFSLLYHLLTAALLLSVCAGTCVTNSTLGVQAGERAQPSGSSAVYQAPGMDPKQRWWQVLDSAFILPEYIAEVAVHPEASKTHACLLRHTRLH